MEKNIFEGAKFGDKFLTRDNKIAIFWFLHENTVFLILDYKEVCNIQVFLDGSNCANKYNDTDWFEKYHNLDIVSRYQEPINEEKLDKLAMNKFEEKYNNTNSCDEPIERVIRIAKWFKFGFKAGYRKAMEDLL